MKNSIYVSKSGKIRECRISGIFYYNNLDVIGLVEGIGKMSQIDKNQRLNMFKDAASLPKLTQKQIFRPLKEDYF